MKENVLLKVKSCPETDVLALTYYLYQLCLDEAFVSEYKAMQVLFNALVERLGLQEHLESILNIFIQKLVKEKSLVPVEVSCRYRHPYDYKRRLKINYREDEDIYQNTGAWTTNTIRDIDLARIVFCFSKTKCYFSKIIALTFFKKPGSVNLKDTALSAKIAVPATIKKALEDVSSVQFAVDVLKLNKDEGLFLQTVYRLQSIKEMYDVCNSIFQDENASRLDIHSKCMGKTQREIRMMLKNDQKLVAYGLINRDGELETDAIDAISEKDMRLYFIDIIKNEKPEKSYEPNSFSISKEKTEIAIQLLKSKNACNILLYGAPGSGKTEYAKMLLKQCGLKMATYKNELEVCVQDDSETKAISRLNCYLSLKKDDSVLIVDEAENVLQTKEFNFFHGISSSKKGTVNRMLEKSENKVIWIVNYTNEMDESTLRRFTYSIKFSQMPKQILRSIAESKLKTLNIPASLKTDILDMSSKYKVTGASVENIVKAINSFDYQSCGENKILSDVKLVLEANSSLLYGRKKIREEVKSSYNLSVLNTSVKACEIVEMLKNAEENKDEKNPAGVRMLFYGMSGTGKTELARYIAETLQKPLLLKRCSDLISPYVGKTESNIKAAFDEAESCDSIFLIDEADSFFSDRSMASYNWERTMVNEFLTQMEEFCGIMICTTNLRKIMDPAMQRRFHIITEFKPLTEQGIQALLKNYFGSFSFENSQLEKLFKCGAVTPGDFGSLSGRLRFVAKEKLTSEYIVQELLKIQMEKRMNGIGQIGFAS